MDVGDLLRRLQRRRWLVGVVVLVAVVAAAISWGTAGSSQQSGAAVVIVPPPLGNAVSDQNPLLNLNDNLAELATVLAASLNSAEASSLLQARKATAAFTVSTITGDNPSFSRLSPQLVFQVTGSTAAAVERTATALVTVSRNRLAALQATADVPSDARAVLVEVVAPTPAEVVGGGRLRSAGTIGLGIVVLGLVVVLVWDEFRRRRFERSAAGTFRRPRRKGPRRTILGRVVPDGMAPEWLRGTDGGGDPTGLDDDAPPVFRSR